MAYTVSCADMGVQWCNHVLHGDTEEELIAHALGHGLDHAGLSEEQLRTPEFLAYLRNAMKPTD